MRAAWTTASAKDPIDAFPGLPTRLARCCGVRLTRVNAWDTNALRLAIYIAGLAVVQAGLCRRQRCRGSGRAVLRAGLGGRKAKKGYNWEEELHSEDFGC